MKFVALAPVIMTFMVGNVMAGQLTYTFKDPSFSGDSTWSSHVLTIENEEFQRKQAIEQAKQAAAAAALAQQQNSTLNQFINNLQTRIYAQMSQQLANDMFSGTGTNNGSFNLEGTTINWVKNANNVTMDIIDPTGNQTDIVVPIGTFVF
jgi:curli production assembly/transport component CsgF